MPIGRGSTKPILGARAGGIALLTEVNDNLRMETPHERVWLGIRGWRRPRARWFVLGAVLVFLFAGLIAGAVAWVSYQPLTSGCCRGWGNEGNRSIYGWTLRNDGKFDVRVTSIEMSDIPGIFTGSRVELGERANVYDITPREPLRAFTLSPGEERMILVSGIVSCAKAKQGIGATLLQQHVHFDVLGLAKVRWISFEGFDLRPPASSCQGLGS